MNSLLKFAVGAAIGGALMHLWMSRSEEDDMLGIERDTSGPPLETASDDRPASSVDDLVAARGAQSALDS